MVKPLMSAVNLGSSCARVACLLKSGPPGGLASSHALDVVTRGKKHTAEEIVAKLHQVDALILQGPMVAEAIRTVEVTEVTYCRWCYECGGLKGDQVKRLKSFETENLRLRRPSRM